MRRRRRALVACLLMAGALAGCARTSTDGGSGASTVPPGTAGVAATYAVGIASETFVDTRRPTQANGDAPARPDRTLVTTIFYPAADEGPFPLIVFGHGFTGTPKYYEGLLRAWAASGYVVAAPAFPLSNGDAQGGPNQNDVINQPGDASFVVTRMLELSGRGDGPLRGLIDPRHIGVAGHSAGGTTAMGVALNTCCRDDRIGAAAVLASGEIMFPGGSFRVPDPVPVLFVHGDADQTIAVSTGRQAFTNARAPKFFVTLLGGDHTSAFSGPRDGLPAADVVVRTTIDFFDRYLKGRAGALPLLRRNGAVAGVATIDAVEK